MRPCEACARPSDKLWKVKVMDGCLSDVWMLCQTCSGYDEEHIEPDYQHPLQEVNQ